MSVLIGPARKVVQERLGSARNRDICHRNRIYGNLIHSRNREIPPEANSILTIAVAEWSDDEWRTGSTSRGTWLLLHRRHVSMNYTFRAEIGRFFSTVFCRILARMEVDLGIWGHYQATPLLVERDGIAILWRNKL